MAPVRGLFPRVNRVQPPLRVHTELHRLTTALQDAMERLIKTEPTDRVQYLDAYAAFAQRRKELYEWVMVQVPRPTDAYAIHLNF